MPQLPSRKDEVATWDLLGNGKVGGIRQKWMQYLIKSTNAGTIFVVYDHSVLVELESFQAPMSMRLFSLHQPLDEGLQSMLRNLYVGELQSGILI